MLSAPFPLVGVRGIRTLARRVGSLPVASDPAYALKFIGHIVRMQEEIGTGGGGFRFLFASFLQEAARIMAKPALQECSAMATAIGDEWRAFALACARMVRGRDTVDMMRLRGLLEDLAAREADMYKALRAAI
jgi:hypothetical protein